MYADPSIADLMPLLILNCSLILLFILYFAILKTRHKYRESRRDHNTHPLVIKVKEFWYWLTTPLFKFFNKTKAQPNALTTLGFLFFISASFSFASGYISTGGWMILIAATFGTIKDRLMEHHSINKSTIFYNDVLEPLSEALLFLGLLVMYFDHWMFYVTFFALLTSIMIRLTRLQGESFGIELKTQGLQRSWRIAFIGLPAILWPMLYVIFEPMFSFFEYELGTRVGLIIILILGVQTLYGRFIYIYSSLGGKFRRH